MFTVNMRKSIKTMYLQQIINPFGKRWKHKYLTELKESDKQTDYS